MNTFQSPINSSMHGTAVSCPVNISHSGSAWSIKICLGGKGGGKILGKIFLGKKVKKCAQKVQKFAIFMQILAKFLNLAKNNFKCVKTHLKLFLGKSGEQENILGWGKWCRHWFHNDTNNKNLVFHNIIQARLLTYCKCFDWKEFQFVPVKVILTSHTVYNSLWSSGMIKSEKFVNV